MMRIEHISFEFAAADERFVHDLYADWDGFCRNYFEKTVDECLSPLDKDKVLHEIELLECNLPEIKVRVVCSKGTYIRALARDIGETLNSGAHLTALQRTRVGDVRIEDPYEKD